MKIFVSEYIVLYETFEFNLYEELSIINCFFDYSNYFESLYKLQNRFVFKKTYFIYDAAGKNLFLRKKQYAHTFLWRRFLKRRNIYFKLLPFYFLPRKWLKIYVLKRTIPMCNVFNQYGYINELVKHFYVNHAQTGMFRIEFPKMECALIFDHVNLQFPRKINWLLDHKRWHGMRFTFYKARPHRLELLPFELRWFKDGVLLSILNPDSRHFTGGSIITYARKWVYYTYMIYNGDRKLPFIVFGYWTSNFFTEIFSFRVLHYRYEVFGDSIGFVEDLIGTTENMKFYLYGILKISLFYQFLFWFSIFFALGYSKEKMVRLIILEEHRGHLDWFYGFGMNYLAVTQNLIRRWRIKRFKYEGRRITRKSHIESRMVRILKNYVYVPISVWYLNNVIKTRRYIDKIERNFLGNSMFYDSDKNYFYLFLMMCNIPFRIMYCFKRIFYSIHIFYYLKLNRYLHYWTLHNPRINYLFNRFFNSNIVYRRDLDQYSSFAVIERIMNYRNLYMNKDFRELITNYVYHLYQIQLHSRTGKRREEYYDYFYFRTFGNYEPEREFFSIVNARFFTRWWYYNVDFSQRWLITHRFFEFFNFITSPLHIRSESNSVFNFYYILIYSKYYFYYYYYIYFFFNRFVDTNLLFIYLYYGLSICFYFYSVIIGFINFMFDGRKNILFFLKNNIYIFYLYLKRNYFFLRFLVNLSMLILVSLYYILNIIYINIKDILLFLGNSIFTLFSDILVVDFGLNYSIWYRYYIVKFYLIEYNIILYFFKFVVNLLFNLLLLVLFFFIISSIPSIKDLLFSDYLISTGYAFINKVFVYNKVIYFDEVLDNWWVPYFDPQKFIKFYNGYLNFFEVRLRKLFGKFIVETAHLGKRKYFYNEGFFELYFTRYFKYLQLRKYSDIYLTFRRWFPGSFPWELYIYMSSYFWLVRHPARHFMVDIFFNTMPIEVSFFLRYKFFLFISKIFVSIFWFWKHSYSYFIFIVLYYTNNTILFDFSLNFLKFWFNIYHSLRYYLFYFCYYYYYYFWFSFSKLMRYYFVTFDFLNYFWIYRSARFIVSVDIFNFFRFSLDLFYYILLNSFANFFQFVYNSLCFVLNLFGLGSSYNNLIFSGNIISRFHLFISNWFDKLITLNYEIDEYGRILHKYFRHRTRGRLGEWYKRDLAVRSFYKLIHRTTKFEFIFREFLFYTKKGLMENFLIQNKVRTNNFNLFFFSFSSVYLHYMFFLFFLSLISFRLRIFFKDETFINFTPFFEWERFNKKNRNLLGRIEFYWLYNIRWLKRFEFYIDKHFTDDLYARTFRHSDINLGFFVYNNFTDAFIRTENKFYGTLKYNKFLVYKRYFVERYLVTIKNIDLLFYEYFISNKDKVNNQNIFSYYDLFIPSFDEKKFEFDFKKDLIKNFSHLDYFWLYFAVPQLFYTRNWNSLRVMTKDEISKNLFLKIKKSLFKAYSYYEISGTEAPYDLFEFQFFEPKVYDAFLLENANPGNYSKLSNKFLQKVALSRWNMELVYDTPGKSFFELYAHVGYHDWINKFEYYLDYLRSCNETYFNNMVDLGIFSFIKPMHMITTHMDADVVKSTIDLSLDDSAVGVKYSELYQYEDLGRVATEQFLFKFLEKVFHRSIDDPSISFVAMSDDTTVTQRNLTAWTVLILILPMIMIFCFFLNYLYVSRYILPQIFIKEVLYFFIYHLSSMPNAEVWVSHKMCSIEHQSQFYWTSPWLWVRTHIFDLYFIDRYSFWTGKYAKFLQAKNEYLWFFSIIAHDQFRYDTLTFLYWNFYIVAWRECKESVIFFFIVDLIFYFLSILFFLFIFNFFLWLSDFSRYFSKQANVVLDNKFDMEKYGKENEKKNKKAIVFEFIDMDAFKDYRGKVNIYERNEKLRRKI